MKTAILNIRNFFGIGGTDKEVQRILEPVRLHTRQITRSAVILTKVLKTSHSYQIGKGMGVIR